MKKKINYDRQKPSSEEINAGKNFDSLLQQFNASAGQGAAAPKAKPFWKTGWFAGSLAVAATLAVSLTLYFTRNEVAGTGSDQPGVANNGNGPTTRRPELLPNTVEASAACIAPPFRNLDIPYNSFKVKSEKASELAYPSGSRIRIPAGAFVDEKGQPVAGEVEVKYRELRDPVDFFLSGIPMAYDSAGVKYHFESAGMIDIAAFKNGKVVYMNPAKKVEIQLASDNPSTAFNLYRLDTASHNWIYLGKDKIEPKDKSVLPGDENLASIKAKADLQLAEVKSVNDKTVARIEAVRDEKLAQLETRMPLPQDIPQEPKKASKTNHRFNVQLDYSEFPEMKAFKGVLWEVDQTAKKFDRKIYDIEWEDIRLVAGEKQGAYVAVLKKGLRTEKIDVYPVFEGRNFEEAQAEYQKKFAAYNNALTNRKAEEKRLREEYESQMRAQQLAYQKFQDQIKKQMAQAIEDFNKQFASMSTDQQVFRIFNISGFGVYNCDSPHLYPTGADIMATFTDESDRQLVCKTQLYLVDKARNGMFTYYANPEKSFRFSPTAENILWTVANGRLYTYMPDEFEKLPVSGPQQVSLKPVNKEFKTPDEMRAYFGI